MTNDPVLGLLANCGCAMTKICDNPKALLSDTNISHSVRNYTYGKIRNVECLKSTIILLKTLKYAQYVINTHHDIRIKGKINSLYARPKCAPTVGCSAGIC
jgi:vancomycin permeability regulator SanA